MIDTEIVTIAKSVMAENITKDADKDKWERRYMEYRLGRGGGNLANAAMGGDSYTGQIGGALIGQHLYRRAKRHQDMGESNRGTLLAAGGAAAGIGGYAALTRPLKIDDADSSMRGSRLLNADAPVDRQRYTFGRKSHSIQNAANRAFRTTSNFLHREDFPNAAAKFDEGFASGAKSGRQTKALRRAVRFLFTRGK